MELSTDEWKQSIGKRCKHQREKRNLTRKDLIGILARLYHLDYTESHIAKVESGESFPGHQLLKALADLYEIDFNFLLAFDGGRTTPIPDLADMPGVVDFFAAMDSMGISGETFMKHIEGVLYHLLASMKLAWEAGRKKED